ncbi:MAG: hypothetical protein C0407_14410, partial [Desulfobacca sp.]|nr:hypothetical protein [Desulfobacca sp.]
PFHRTKRSQAAGSGLGLAIARKIIESHGGIIGAYNAEMGLEIRLSLPAQAGSKKEKDNQQKLPLARG